MRRAATLLLASLLLAGCFAEDDGADADEADDGTESIASPAPATSPTPAAAQAAPGCSESEVELLSWTSDENPADHEFDVVGGTTSLEAQWTHPTAAARAYRASITDPAEEVVFLQERSEGFQVGEGGVSLEGQHSDTEIRGPPAVGTYRFRFVSEGVVEGAALRVVATSCA